MLVSVGIFENQVYPDIPRLEVLGQAGRLLYLVTVKPTIFARRILDYFSLARHFHSVHGSDLNDRYTEKAIFIRRALEAESVEPYRGGFFAGGTDAGVLALKVNLITTEGQRWPPLPPT